MDQCRRSAFEQDLRVAGLEIEEKMVKKITCERGLLGSKKSTNLAITKEVSQIEWRGDLLTWADAYEVKVRIYSWQPIYRKQADGQVLYS